MFLCVHVNQSILLLNKCFVCVRTLEVYLLKVYHPDNPSWPSQRKANLGLVMMLMMMMTPAIVRSGLMSMSGLHSSNSGDALCV